MPYKLSPDKKCVLHADTGKVMKCYDNEEQALRYLKALYANVPDASKSDIIQQISTIKSRLIPSQKKIHTPTAELPQASDIGHDGESSEAVESRLEAVDKQKLSDAKHITARIRRKLLK